MSIPGPTFPSGDENRAIDCEFALEPAFEALCTAGEVAGWTPEEVDEALIGLVEARVAARRENAATDAAIAKARRKVGQ